MPRKKSPVTPPGIDPGTFRLVAQSLTTTAPQAHRGMIVCNMIEEVVILATYIIIIIIIIIIINYLLSAVELSLGGSSP
jgi:hypothetical protein